MRRQCVWLLALGASFAACGRCNPPVADLQFRSFSTVVFSDSPVGNIHTYNATNLTPLPAAALDRMVAVHYSNRTPSFTHQTDVSVFARDPDEQLQTFQNNLENVADWNANVATPFGETARTVALPDEFVLPYQRLPTTHRWTGRSRPTTSPEHRTTP